MQINNQIDMKEYNECIYVPCRFEENIEIGCYDQNGSFISYTGKRIIGQNNYRFSQYKIKEEDIEERRDEDVIWLGHFRKHYGHFLVDEMSRLWWLCLNKYVGYTIVFDYDEGDLPPFYFELFDVIRDKYFFQRVTRITQYKRVLIPQLSYIPGQYISPLFYMTFQKVVSETVLSKPNNVLEGKIYLSRLNFSNENRVFEFGEKFIEKTFRDNGFLIVYPEKMPFLEQIKLYNQCELIVSTNGTLAHNILWCKKGIKQVVLNRFRDENVHQEAIWSVSDVEVIQIDCFLKGSTHDCSCYVPSKELRQFFDENELKFHYNFVGDVLNRFSFCVVKGLKKIKNIIFQ